MILGITSLNYFLDAELIFFFFYVVVSDHRKSDYSVF